MKFHFDDTSIKVLVGVVASGLIFVFVLTQFGTAVEESSYDDPDSAYDPPDNDTSLDESEDDWFGGGYISKIIDSIDMMRTEIGNAPSIVPALFIIIFLTVSLLILRSFEWGL